MNTPQITPERLAELRQRADRMPGELGNGEFDGQDVDALLREIDRLQVRSLELDRIEAHVQKHYSGGLDLPGSVEHDVLCLIQEVREQVGSISALESELKDLGTEIVFARALTIGVRAYVLSHDLLIRECVAWNELKRRLVVGQSQEEDMDREAIRKAIAAIRGVELSELITEELATEDPQAWIPEPYQSTTGQ